MKEPKVEIISKEYIIVTTFKKVWYKKSPKEYKYIFRGLIDANTNQFLFNGYDTCTQAEKAIRKVITIEN